jgi:NADH-quinone oxidoreductase subunit N
MLDFMLFLPLIIVGAGAILLMLFSAFEKVTNQSAASLSMGMFGVAFVAQLLACTATDVALFNNVFNGMLIVNPFTKVAGLIILGCGFFTSLISRSYFEERCVNSLEYYCLIVFAASGMLLLTMAAELITAFIALEIMSLAIYVLVATDRKSITATEAVLKYLMLGAFAGAFFTMGAALIYGGVGSTKFELIGAFLHEYGFMANGALLGGSFLVIVALLFKVAAFPFHAWVVDVYDGATIPITGFMATALKTAVFVMFANFLNIDGGLQQNWVTFLFWAAVLTMFAGNLIAMAQENLKRMLAASGIVHSGYLLIGLVALNDTALSVNIIIYYLAAYAVGTIGMFAALSYLGGGNEKRIHYEDFKGLAKVRPYSAAAITIFLLSMAGIPPTAGFMGKLYIITSALNTGEMALAVLGVVSSILSMWYYLRLIINMYFHEAEGQFETDCSSMTSACTMALAVGIFVISFIPIAI